MGLLSALTLTEPLPIAVREAHELASGAILRAILGSLEHGVLLTDLEHRSIACNRLFGELFGVDPFEVVNMGVEELRNRVVPIIIDSEAWRASLERVYAYPTSSFEDEIVLRKEDEIILRRTTTPVLDDVGEPVGRLWSFTDVTDAHQRRRKLELLRNIAGLTDPDPSTALAMICQAVSDYYGGDTVAKVTIREGNFLRFHVVAGDLGPAKGLPGINMTDTYCGFTLGNDRALLVQNASSDPKFASLLPATVGYCRYLGVPVRDELGRAIGTLCIVDVKSDRMLGPADVEMIETVSLRVNAELNRERYLRERIAVQERRHETERRELDETRTVLQSMNDSFALLFESRERLCLLHEQARRLRGVLGYESAAVFVRSPGAARFEGALCDSAGASSDVDLLDTEHPFLLDCVQGGSREVAFLEGDKAKRLSGLPWAAIACLPEGEWGQAVVVLGRTEEPPREQARHLVQLSSLMDGVRLVLAAHVLNAGIVEANTAALNAREKALSAEKLAVVGTLAASTAHDIRNITASLSMLAADSREPAVSLAAVREQLDRFSVLSHRLLSYARPGSTSARPVDVDELLERVASLTAGQMRVSRVECDLSTEADLPPILGDGHQLEHLFVNLVLNAVQAMERKGGHLRLEGRKADDEVEVRVADDGPGIPTAVAGRLFEPFASSRPQGFGLGLFSARRIAEAHGGSIAVESREGKGTTMTVRLPVCKGRIQ